MYYAFVYKLDDQIRALVENISMNKHAGGGGNVECKGVVALCHDALAGISVSRPSE